MNTTTPKLLKTIPKKIMGYLKFAHFIINHQDQETDILHTLFLDKSIEEIVALVNDIVVNGDQDKHIIDLRKQFILSSKPKPIPKPKPKSKTKAKAKAKTNAADIIVDDLVTLARTAQEEPIITDTNITEEPIITDTNVAQEEPIITDTNITEEPIITDTNVAQEEPNQHVLENNKKPRGKKSNTNTDTDTLPVDTLKKTRGKKTNTHTNPHIPNLPELEFEQLILNPQLIINTQDPITLNLPPKNKKQTH